MKNRVLYVVRRYPQVSETYIETEIRYLSKLDELMIVSLKDAPHPTPEHHPFQTVGLDDRSGFLRIADEFAPDVVHGHYLHHATALLQIATLLDCCFTVRAHSYDVLDRSMADLRELAQTANHDRCLGVLTFPFTVERLLDAGLRQEKLVPCYPVVDFARFYDTSPNGTEIMNIGAALPKKNHKSYVDLARRMPERTFNLYAMGYGTEATTRYNQALGNPVSIKPVLPHSQMPKEYKRHEWLVYTASMEKLTVGWPMAVAEAQAAGVGVCVQNIRPDVREYVGAAGYVFDSIEEVAEIISGSFDDSRRRLAVAQALRSDTARHIGILRNLWGSA